MIFYSSCSNLILRNLRLDHPRHWCPPWLWRFDHPEEACCGESGVFSFDPDAAVHCYRASQPPLKRGQSNINSTPRPAPATVAAHLTVQGI